MSVSKKTSFNTLKNELAKEYTYLKNVFKIISIPLQMKGDNVDDFLDVHNKCENKSSPQRASQTSNRARSISELEEKLEKIKSEKSFTLKNKFMKKSLMSKLNKKAKKMERIVKNNKQRRDVESAFGQKGNKTEKSNANLAKPVFNSDAKLVFSKFDFAGIGEKKDKLKKSEKDPKQILNDLQKQEEKVQQLQESGENEKVTELRSKIAWKNILKKAEGEKVKDDPILLKKTVKKMEQKKKHSKKQWDTRTKNVQLKIEERQKKRQENISNKQKEKKAKKMKTAAKKGRIVI